jgi:hypothetical protein
MLDLSIFTVGDFRKKNRILTLSIKVLFVTWIRKIVLTRAWVLFAWKIVVACLIWLK